MLGNDVARREETLGRIDKRDVAALIKASNEDRVEELIPIRHGWMLQSPFAFFPGSAALQAYDFDRTPVSGIDVQACGDCHLVNFGGFATPERNLVFDINDLDETLPAPGLARFPRLLDRTAARAVAISTSVDEG